MQCNPNTTLIFCSLLLTFDILCIMSLSFEKQKCDVCTNSNLTSYVTMYLLIPYVFFGKHKIVDIILKAFEGDIDTTIDIEKHPSKIQIILEWSFYALLFCFGILEFKVSCIGKLSSSFLYWTALLVTVFSGFICISQFILSCCGATISIVREPPNNEYNIPLIEVQK